MATLAGITAPCGHPYPMDGTHTCMKPAGHTANPHDSAHQYSRAALTDPHDSGETDKGQAISYSDWRNTWHGTRGSEADFPTADDAWS